MPVYSISRTSQYTTITALETKANQDGFSWNGFDLQAYASNFVVTYLTVVPLANRTWDYQTPASPVAAHVWYPYSISMAVSGGEPSSGSGDRPGLAYLKLYTSTGSYLMGSYTSNSLANGGQIWAGASVQATTFSFTDSRNTLTMTANTTYVAGFAAPTTATAFWNIFARTTGQSGQNIYFDNSSAYNGAMSLASTFQSTQSLMGFITYNAAPVKPTNLVITTKVDGIEITCQGNEVQSTSSGTNGNITQVMFFYSTTEFGTYNVLGTDTTITRTLVSGTTYEYTAQMNNATSVVTLEIGRSYYFKVATINDLCVQYQSELAGRVIAGEQSDTSLAQYGKLEFIKVRNATNTAWQAGTINYRNATNTAWISGTAKERDSTNNYWLGN